MHTHTHCECVCVFIKFWDLCLIYSKCSKRISSVFFFFKERELAVFIITRGYQRCRKFDCCSTQGLKLLIYICVSDIQIWGNDYSLITMSRMWRQWTNKRWIILEHFDTCPLLSQTASILTLNNGFYTHTLKKYGTP